MGRGEASAKSQDGFGGERDSPATSDQLHDINVGWARDMRTALVMLACVTSCPAPVKTLSFREKKKGEAEEKGKGKKRPAPR